jgi:hypothetical protein
MIYTNCFTIFILIVINNQTNKQWTIHYLLMKSVTWENKNKNFMDVFDITKKYYKLSCMDNVKTWPLCQVNIPSRLDEK